MLTFRARAPSIAAHFFAALVGVLLSGIVDAAQRTFVASYGSDSNACVLTAPCRSFAAAITHTDTDGEIIVVDSGGYGRVTIDRSVSITAPPGIYAGISVFSGANGIDIATPGIVVALRGLTINGQGGDIGIAFTHGASLHVDRCVIANMSEEGIRLELGEVYVTETALLENGNGGIRAQSHARVAIERTRFEHNGATGLYVSNGASVVVTNSVFAGNLGLGGIAVTTNDGTSETRLAVTNSNLGENPVQGILASASGAGSVTRVAIVRNTIVGNDATGVALSALTGTVTGVITDNAIERNGGNGGISAGGAGVSATIAGNAISGNSLYGIKQAGSAVLKTRSNNIVQDNATDVFGTLTPVTGD